MHGKLYLVVHFSPCRRGCYLDIKLQILTCVDGSEIKGSGWGGGGGRGGV